LTHVVGDSAAAGLTAMNTNQTKRRVSALLSVPVVAVLLLAVPVQSRAQVSDALFSELVAGQSNSAPGTVNETTTNGYGSETSIATTSANLSVSTGSMYTGPDNNASTLDGTGEATIYYYYQVVSPPDATPGATVPMTISANLTTAASGFNSSADTAINLGYQYNPEEFIGSIGATTSCSASTCTSQSDVLGALGKLGTLTLVNLPFSVFADTPAYVELLSESGTAYGSGMASATVDPVIAIDPTWLAENPGYTLEISSNVTQTPPVPLPASAWLMLSALGGLALIGRRRIALQR